MLTSDLQKLSVAGLVTLYELDATKLGAGVYRWHGHIGREDWLYIFRYLDKSQYLDKTDTFNAIDTIHDLVRRDIIWQNQVYTPVAIQTDGLEMRGDGRPSTPQLSLANNISGVQNAVTQLCAFFDDFCGAQLRVIHTLAKHLDAANFTDGNASADTTQYREQYWLVEHKIEESLEVVTFELSNPLSAQEKKIPARDITSYCSWAAVGEYRGESCGYTGSKMFTIDGEPTTNAALDKCGGRLKDCKLRFGEFEPLSFGGFVGANLGR